eukprot:284767_1
MGNETSHPSQENATTRNTIAYEWNNKKMMHKWNKHDVKDYIKSLTYTECTRNVMKKKINGKELLLAKTPDELATKLGIPPAKAEGLFELINIQKRLEVAKKVKHTPKSTAVDFNESKYPQDDEDDCAQESAIINDLIVTKKQFLIDHKKQNKCSKKMDYNLHFEASNSWQGRAMIDWTVYNMKSWFVSELNNSKINPNYRKQVFYNRKQVLDAMDEILLNGSQMMNIEDSAMLSAALNINKKICEMIYNSFLKRVEKEADDDEKYDKKSRFYTMDKNEYNRIRMLPYDKYTWIILSDKPDCIMGYSDEDNICRAEMSCKHAIAADTMFFYIKSIIEKNKEAVIIKCPVEKCDTEWDWDSCLKIADMTKHEIIKYNAIKSNRMRRKKFKNCPACGVKAEKPKTLNQFRVVCTRCNSYDWCFICEQKWQGSGLILCGNKNCSVVSEVNKILKECEMKPVTGIKNGKIPKYRACPNCLIFIEHTKYCKHMQCRGKECQTQFCFLCLAIRDPKKGWPASCRGYSKNTSWEAGANVSCKLADRQYFK